MFLAVVGSPPTDCKNRFVCPDCRPIDEIISDGGWQRLLGHDQSLTWGVRQFLTELLLQVLPRVKVITKALNILALRERVQCRCSGLLDRVTSLALVVRAKSAPQLEAVALFTSAKILPLAVQRI